MATPLRVKNRITFPPGGVWTYYDPDLEQIVEHYGMLDDFADVVNSLRETNGLEALPDMQDRVEKYICENSPPGFCNGPVEARPMSRTLTVSKIATFTRTLVQILRSKLANEEIYNPDPNKAAEICAACPLNKKHLCSSCTGLEVLARRLLRATQTTPLDRNLGACEACGCMLRVKVHFNPKVLRDATSKTDEKRYPKDYCWIWKDQS